MSKAINFLEVLLEVDGTPSSYLTYDETDAEFVKANGYKKITGKKDNTLQKTVVELLNVIEKESNPEENVKQGFLIVKITKGVRKNLGLVELEAEEVTMIKGRAKKYLHPIYSVQVCDLVEGNENPFLAD